MLRVLLLILFGLTSVFAVAQPLHLMTQSDGNVVRLRWAIEDPADWEWANANGYTITRMTRRANGQLLSVGEQGLSRQTLVDQWRPRPLNDWSADDLEQAARNVLDAAQWTVNNPDEFAAAAEASTNRDNRLFFAHALAERDFALARGLALGYQDDTAEPDKDYVYIVTINGLQHNGVGAAAGAKGGLERGIDDLAPIRGLRVESGDTTVRVAWSTEGTAHLYTSYDIFRAPEGTTTFTRANDIPFMAGYYYVELEDENGHTYRSQPQVDQLVDQTPPAVPTGFSGEDRGDGTVLLTWNGSPEADLNGYQLFRCYARGGEFASVEVDLLTDTIYVDDLTGTIINDSIFYRLRATDLRDNASDMTPVLVLERVDITPPGKPTLARVNPTPAGVALTWTYSADDDVVRHELQRRPKGTADWQTVVTVPAGTEADFTVPNFDADGAINYLDDERLPRQDYDYQFLAFDDADLGAGSEIVTVRPHDSGERGEIQDLAIAATCTDSTVVTDLDEATSYSIQNFLDAVDNGEEVDDETIKALFRALEMSGLATATQFEEWQSLSLGQLAERIKEIQAANAPETKFTNCSITLQWSYPLDASIQHFQLYRSRRGSRLRPYKALPVEHFYDGTVPSGRQLLSFTDEGALPGARYVYKVMAVHWDGGYSREGSGVTVVVE